MPYPAHAVLGFPGQFANSQQLAGAQHYYNRYRDYDVNTGRYIQADPIGLAGDDNPYAYAGGNPLRYVDPFGLEGINLFNPNDAAAGTANKLVAARGGHFYVAGHGSRGRIVDYRNGSRPIGYRVAHLEAFVKMLREAGLKQGQVIVLASCNMDQDGGQFARMLAARTGSVVYATSDFVAYGSDGVVFPRHVRSVGAYGTGVWTPHGAGSNRLPNIRGVRLNNFGFLGVWANPDYAPSQSPNKPDWKVQP
ncbi:RHS repeat-associated core domain-containing protein [Aquidulcibacter sp.]|uniref:RHS repeat-associated core domain-containing protein n=1 Tax=Aquidulcibacter sp. TaxID=2052990 RepID=UPI0025BB4553|nr:RHS repeat-associated core domain-containing protein [Aquidulcibacter sp.]